MFILAMKRIVVLCSDDFSVEAYRTVTKGFSGRFTSDHFPIYADLKF